MAARSTWIISTDGKRSLRAIAKDLARADFMVDQILTEVGCITGSTAAGSTARLRKIQGVIDVSPDTPLNIGPPDSPETW